jgi:hypothetical protein
MLFCDSAAGLSLTVSHLSICHCDRPCHTFCRIQVATVLLCSVISHTRLPKALPSLVSDSTRGSSQSKRGRRCSVHPPGVWPAGQAAALLDANTSAHAVQGGGQLQGGGVTVSHLLFCQGAENAVSTSTCGKSMPTAAESRSFSP